MTHLKSDEWAEAFRALRGSMTQADAAKALCGVSVRTVQDWESGRRQPPDWVQLLIAGHLGTRKKARQRSASPVDDL